MRVSNYEGFIVRGMEIPDIDAFIEKFKVDDIFTTNQYLSFSIGKTFNEYANVKIYIENSKYALYERNKKFKILNVVKRDDIIYMVWEEIK